MPALVENNFIYIAQPPLYRISRKKTSRYIHSEKEMDEYLLELGISDIKMKLPNDADYMSTEKMKDLLKLIVDLESFVLRIERKGITFREFIHSKNSQGMLPRFQVTLTDGLHFAYSLDEFEELKVKNEQMQRAQFEQTLASIPEKEITSEMRVFKSSRLHFVELYEEEYLDQLNKRLAVFGYDITSYLIADGLLLEIQEDEHKHEFYVLQEVLDFLRNNGRKGIEIQRYKGLGEMNADQLWETTMDPDKRSLILVTLPDIVAADHMFTMLMGEEVPPRRAFIEQHALSVKNLDI